MLLSEEEAKEKWCPFVRWHSDVNGTWESNRDSAFAHQRCIASRCMAWRPTRSTVTAPVDEYPGEGWNKDGPAVAGDDGPMQRWVLLRGYCGLAGKPFD